MEEGTPPPSPAETEAARQRDSAAKSQRKLAARRKCEECCESAKECCQTMLKFGVPMAMLVGWIVGIAMADGTAQVLLGAGLLSVVVALGCVGLGVTMEWPPAVQCAVSLLSLCVLLLCATQGEANWALCLVTLVLFGVGAVAAAMIYGDDDNFVGGMGVSVLCSRWWARSSCSPRRGGQTHPRSCGAVSAGSTLPWQWRR